MSNYQNIIQNALPYCLNNTNFSLDKKYQGKVRDTYDLGETLILITTDRQSAFDRVLATVPFKGQVLNLTSAWWFEKTSHIIPNHVISIPDPNVTLAKKCKIFPIEFVVRAYMTGSTKTSIWTQYQAGNRVYCGNILPEGMKKNQALATPILTPTTKETTGDRPISPKEIIEEKWMTAAQWEAASAAALALFEYGTAVAKERNLILVDTKYEMGIDEHGQIILADEIHTPDSSRYWIADTYEERLRQQQEPDNIDKEFLRLWFTQHCNPYEDKILPVAPEELIVKLSSRYIQLYESIVGEAFPFPQDAMPVVERIRKNMEKILFP